MYAHKRFVFFFYCYGKKEEKDVACVALLRAFNEIFLFRFYFHFRTHHSDVNRIVHIQSLWEQKFSARQSHKEGAISTSKVCQSDIFWASKSWSPRPEARPEFFSKGGGGGQAMFVQTRKSLWVNSRRQSLFSSLGLCPWSRLWNLLRNTQKSQLTVLIKIFDRFWHILTDNLTAFLSLNLKGLKVLKSRNEKSLSFPN